MKRKISSFARNEQKEVSNKYALNTVETAARDFLFKIILSPLNVQEKSKTLKNFISHPSLAHFLHFKRKTFSTSNNIKAVGSFRFQE